MGQLSALGASWAPVLRRLAAPTLGSFFCAVLVVVRPVAALSGKYAFLVLTDQVLFFFPGGTVGAQLEATVLGLVGGFVGVAWACIGVAGAAHLNRLNGGSEANASRVLAALFLTAQAVVGGYIRSSSPRLTSATRIALFNAIWICANDFSATELTSDIPLILVYPMLFAAGTSLLARILLPKTSAGRFISLTQKAFETSETLLLAVVEDFFDATSTEDELEAPKAHNVPALRKRLLAHSTELPKAFAQASFEVSLSRYHPDHLRPFIATIRELGQHLAAGTSYFTGSSPSEAPAAGRPSFEGRAQSRKAFERPTRAFIGSMVVAFGVVHQTLAGEDAGPRILDAQERLHAQRAVFIRETDRQLDAAIERWEAHFEADDGLRAAEGSPQLDKDLLLISLFNYKCLEVAQTLEDVLDIAMQLSSAAVRARSIHLPRLSRQWLVSNSISARWDETARDQSGAEGQEDLDGMETRAAIASAFLAYPQEKRARVGTVTWMSQKLLPVWDSRPFVSGRMRLVALLHALHQRRAHFQHSFKIGLGIVFLTLPAFLPEGSSGRAWFKDIRGEWIPISYLFVLETSAGQTWRVGTFRVIGTVSGAILACIIAVIAQENPYALVLLTTMYGALTAAIMLFSSFPGVGVVGTITLPPIVFLEYLELPNGGYIDTAWKRTATVCIGIVAAVLANEFIFPARSRALFLGTMAEALDDLTKLYLAMARGNLSPGKRYSLDRSTAGRLQEKIEANLDRSSGHLSTMRLEFSLVHKPLSLYRKVVDAARNLSDVFMEISVIREQIPRQETVHNVLKERKELVSSVMIHLFACTASFRSRSPMPQFLPSPSLAVRNWEISALRGLMSLSAEASLADDPEESLGDIALSSGEVSASRAAVLHRDAAFLYTFAEAEALEEAIRTVDDLTTLVRTLFGTSKFFDGEPIESA